MTLCVVMTLLPKKTAVNRSTKTHYLKCIVPNSATPVSRCSLFMQQQKVRIHPPTSTHDHDPSQWFALLLWPTRQGTINRAGFVHQIVRTIKGTRDAPWTNHCDHDLRRQHVASRASCSRLFFRSGFTTWRFQLVSAAVYGHQQASTVNREPPRVWTACCTSSFQEWSCTLCPGLPEFIASFSMPLVCQRFVQQQIT